MKRKDVPFLRIGLFVLVGFILFIVIIFYLGSKEKMFSSTTLVKARFATVSSLRRGAEIDMAGINIGSVKDIQLPRNARDSVTVTMRIITDALKLIHTDSKASITTQGLIGDKVVYISMGSDSTPAIEPGGTIGVLPQQDYGKIVDTLALVVGQLDSMSHEANQLLHAIRVGNGTLGKLVNDDGLYKDLRNTTTNANALVVSAKESVTKLTTDLGGATGRITAIVDKIERGEGSLGKLISKDDVYDNVRKTTDNLVSSSADLHDALSKVALASGRAAEITEAFKHNFLVKSYFEDRGYWDVPEYEMTIDRKIDSLNRLRKELESRAKR